ncbi:MAG TPA: hypothetical protein VMD30_03205, partial [Tepidisphaeraceae bacterium]|nr:hypothetical protein [Tepidisphaeraceae bacterium]
VDQQTYGGLSGALFYTGNTTINAGTLNFGSDADTQADQSEITSIQAQLTTDQATQSSDASADAAAVQSARYATVFDSAQAAQLASDESRFTILLQSDDTTIRQVAARDLTAVLNDYIAINSGVTIMPAKTPAALPSRYRNDSATPPVTPQEQLAIDQSTLQSGVAAAVAKLESDKVTSTNTLAVDHGAITALLQSTPAYTSAVAKQQSDATTDSNNVQTDQAINSAAQAKLSQDQANALNSSSSGTSSGLTVVTGTGFLNSGSSTISIANAPGTTGSYLLLTGGSLSSGNSTTGSTPVEYIGYSIDFGSGDIDNSIVPVGNNSSLQAGSTLTIAANYSMTIGGTTYGPGTYIVQSNGSLQPQS